MSMERIHLPTEKIRQFCCNNHIRRLSLFGSALRSEIGPNSDIDLLVEFEPGYRIGLIRLAGLELELSALLGRKVDLRTPTDLSIYFRDQVLKEAELQYVQG